jgi:putative ubiquitin-RnfH superfamily antitoxin RatB of RatAB toxin-antitoxin module
MASSHFDVLAIEAFTDHTETRILSVAPGTTVLQALEALRSAAFPPAVRRPELFDKINRVRVDLIGINGVRVELTERLRPLDRLEFYRQLQVDPKAARQARARKLRKEQQLARQIQKQAENARKAAR